MKFKKRATCVERNVSKTWSQLDEAPHAYRISQLRKSQKQLVDVVGKKIVKMVGIT